MKEMTYKNDRRKIEAIAHKLSYWVNYTHEEYRPMMIQTKTKLFNFLYEAYYKPDTELKFTNEEIQCIEQWRNM